MHLFSSTVANFEGFIEEESSGSEEEESWPPPEEFRKEPPSEVGPRPEFLALAAGPKSRFGGVVEIVIRDGD